MYMYICILVEFLSAPASRSVLSTYIIHLYIFVYYEYVYMYMYICVREYIYYTFMNFCIL